MNSDNVPHFVLEALRVVRDLGNTNMMSRDGVIQELQQEGEFDAADWVRLNRTRYLEALNRMAKLDDEIL